MNLKNAVASLAALSIPIILGQIGQMLIGAGDVYIASKYSTEAVASIGIANGVINPFFLFGIGLMMGISPSLSIERGSGKDKRDKLSSIILYAILWSVLITFVTLLANHYLVPILGFQTELVPSIQIYIDIVAWSLPFGIIFQGIKEYLQAYEDVFFANATAIIAVIFNLIANYIFVFGFYSFEGVGEVGLAYASFATRVFQFLIIFLYVIIKEKWHKASLLFANKVFRFSFPIAFMFFLEVLAFCTVTMLAGKISVVAAATNNIIMTFASLVFMVPLSLASAVAVKVGRAHGKNDLPEIKLYLKAVVFSALGFISLSASFIFLAPQFIMHFATTDQVVIDLGVKILFIVAIFQVFDSLQVVLTGVLRGIEQTKISSIMVFIGYWIFGIPTGYYLAFYQKQGAEGLWIGLALSLALVAIFLAIVTKIKLYSRPAT